MWLIAGSAAACAGLTYLGVMVDRRQTPRQSEWTGPGFFRRDDGVFVDQHGAVVDAAEQAHLSYVCSELRDEEGR